MARRGVKIGEPYKNEVTMPPLEKKASDGRVVKYDPDVYMPKILELISKGHLVLEIAAMPDMPGYTTMQQMFLIERWVVPYTRARELQAHAIAERAVNEAERATGDAQLARLKFDARRWFVGKIAPRIYGDRVEHRVEAGESYVEALRLASERIRKRTLEGNRVFDVPDDADAQPKFIGSESVSDATNNRAKSKT
jgi:hypothetical protein